MRKKPMLLMLGLLAINTVFLILSLDREIFPYRHIRGRSIADIAKMDSKPYVKEIFGFFLEIQDLAQGKKLYMPAKPWIQTNDKMGLGLDFFLRYVANLELIENSSLSFSFLPADTVIKTQLIRVFQQPIEFHYAEKAESYVYKSGEIAQILPVVAQ